MDAKAAWFDVFLAWAKELNPSFDYNSLPPEKQEKINKYIGQFDFSKEPIYNSREEAIWFQKVSGEPVKSNGLWANRPRFRFIVAWLVK